MKGRGRLVLAWVGLAVVLVALVVGVGRVDVGLPGTSARIALDFEDAYTRAGWRLFTFLILFAAVMTYSLRRYGRRP